MNLQTHPRNNSTSNMQNCPPQKYNDETTYSNPNIYLFIYRESWVVNYAPPWSRWSFSFAPKRAGPQSDTNHHQCATCRSQCAAPIAGRNRGSKWRSVKGVAARWLVSDGVRRALQVAKVVISSCPSGGVLLCVQELKDSL